MDVLDTISYRQVQAVARYLKMSDRKTTKKSLAHRILEEKGYPTAIIKALDSAILQSIAEKLKIALLPTLSLEDAVLKHLTGTTTQNNKDSDENPLNSPKNGTDRVKPSKAANRSLSLSQEQQKNKEAGLRLDVGKQMEVLYGKCEVVSTSLKPIDSLQINTNTSNTTFSLARDVIREQDAAYNRSLFLDAKKDLMSIVVSAERKRAEVFDANIEFLIDSEACVSRNGVYRNLSVEETRLLSIPRQWRTKEDTTRLKELEEERMVKETDRCALVSVSHGTEHFELVINPSLTHRVCLLGLDTLVDLYCSANERLWVIPLDAAQSNKVLADHQRIKDVVTSTPVYTPESITRMYKELEELIALIDS